MFFEKTGRTREVWFYEIPPPEGRKKYSKTRPMRFEEFADCQAWWGGARRQGRVENECAWRLPIGEIEEDGFNLDRRNPDRSDDLAHRPPEELIAEANQHRTSTDEPTRGNPSGACFLKLVRVNDVLRLDRRPVKIDPLAEYEPIGIRSFGKGIFHYPPTLGTDLSKLRYFEVHPRDSRHKQHQGVGRGDSGCHRRRDWLHRIEPIPFVRADRRSDRR